MKGCSNWSAVRNHQRFSEIVLTPEKIHMFRAACVPIVVSATFNAIPWSSGFSEEIKYGRLLSAAPAYADSFDEVEVVTPYVHGAPLMKVTVVGPFVSATLYSLYAIDSELSYSLRSLSCGGSTFTFPDAVLMSVEDPTFEGLLAFLNSVSSPLKDLIDSRCAALPVETFESSFDSESRNCTVRSSSGVWAEVRHNIKSDFQVFLHCQDHQGHPFDPFTRLMYSREPLTDWCPPMGTTERGLSIDHLCRAATDHEEVIRRAGDVCIVESSNRSLKVSLATGTVEAECSGNDVSDHKEVIDVVERFFNQIDNHKTNFGEFYKSSGTQVEFVGECYALSPAAFSGLSFFNICGY